MKELTEEGITDGEITGVAGGIMGEEAVVSVTEITEAGITEEGITYGEVTGVPGGITEEEAVVSATEGIIEEIQP